MSLYLSLCVNLSPSLSFFSLLSPFSLSSLSLLFNSQLDYMEMSYTSKQNEVEELRDTNRQLKIENSSLKSKAVSQLHKQSTKLRVCVCVMCVCMK